LPDSCSSACIQMLLKDLNVAYAQEAIIEMTGHPATGDAIVRTLNRLDLR
jgi:hypothetical protein